MPLRKTQLVHHWQKVFPDQPLWGEFLSGDDIDIRQALDAAKRICDKGASTIWLLNYLTTLQEGIRRDVSLPEKESLKRANQLFKKQFSRYWPMKEGRRRFKSIQAKTRNLAKEIDNLTMAAKVFPSRSLLSDWPSRYLSNKALLLSLPKDLRTYEALLADINKMAAVKWESLELQAIRLLMFYVKNEIGTYMDQDVADLVNPIVSKFKLQNYSPARLRSIRRTDRSNRTS
jgi:hypothetical protein